jgi:O-antigen/teichoic acid export membrane protein
LRVGAGGRRVSAAGPADPDVTGASVDPVAPRMDEPTGVRRVLQGFAVLALATVATRAIGFVVLALVAREIGPTTLGAYSFALALASYFVAIPSNFGIAILAIRDIARDRPSARPVTGEALVLQAALATGFLLGMLALAPVLSSDPSVRRLLPIVGVYYLVYVLTADWALQAVQRMSAVALVRLAGQVVFGAATPLILVGGLAGAERYAWMTVVGAGVTAGLALALVWRDPGAPIRPRSHRALLTRLRRSMPIGFSLVMLQVYYSVDQVLIGYLKDNEEVGLYAAATKIPFMLIAFSTLWATALYPHASQLFERDRGLLARQVGTFASLGVVVGLPLAVGASLLANDVMVAVFGGAYSGAGTAFALLVWAVAVLFVSVNFANVLLAAGEERRFAIAVTAGAALNVALNFALIPRFGGAGAAAATIAAELAVLIVNLHRLLAVFGHVPLDRRRIGGAVIATAALAATLAAMPAGTPLALRLVVGVGVYIGCAVALKVVRRSDVELLVRRP